MRNLEAIINKKHGVWYALAVYAHTADLVLAPNDPNRQALRQSAAKLLRTVGQSLSTAIAISYPHRGTIDPDAVISAAGKVRQIAVDEANGDLIHAPSYALQLTRAVGDLLYYFFTQEEICGNQHIGKNPDPSGEGSG